MKAESKIRHLGISFHGRTEVLEQILTDYPELEVVQDQFNHVDCDDRAAESRKCYDVCVKRNKPVIVIEPTKGGNLIHLPDTMQKPCWANCTAAVLSDMCCNLRQVLRA